MKHRNLLIFLLITGKDIDTITWKPLLAADLIKALLRELPEPLLTYAFYEPFILLACMYSPTIKPVQSHSLSPKINKAQKDVETRLVKVGTSSKKLLLTLTTSSFFSLGLFSFFAPIFLQRKDGDLDKGVKETTPAIAVVSFLIENHVSLFKVLRALAHSTQSRLLTLQ